MSNRGLRIAFWGLLALGCGASGTDEASPFDEGENAGEAGQESAPELPISPAADALVTRLREQTTRAVMARASSLAADDATELPEPLLFQKSRLSAFHRTLGGLRALAKDRHAPVEVTFPEDFTGTLRLRDVPSALGFELRVVGASPAPAQIADGFLVYRGSYGADTTAFYRAAESGFEDYVLFDSAPATPEVLYALTLNESVAGLRLVANTLEFLDAGGVPRLRVAPPFLIGADGARTEAELAVMGCEVDEDPAPPWGRAVVEPGARECSVQVAWSAADVRYPAVLDPSWSNTSSMAVSRAHATSSLLSTGRVLVTGGVTAGGSVVASAELFDPATGTWSATQAMSSARYLHTATSVSTNEIVVLGGYTALNASPSSSAQRYHPTTGTWSSAGTPGTARAGHAATRLADGSLLVTGGFNASGNGLNSAQRYNPTTRVWSAAAAFTGARGLHTATLLSNGTVLLAGGKSAATGNAAVAAASRYQPSSNSWSSAGNLIVPRFNHTAEAVNFGSTQKVWLAGGQDATGAVTPSTETYLAGSPGTFTRSANLTYPRRHHTATTVGGRVLVTGGIGVGNAAVAVPESMNPTYEVISEAPPLGTARAYHTAVRLDTTRVLVAGGSQAATLGAGSSVDNSAELFDSTTPAVTATEYKEVDVSVPEIEINEQAPVDIWARYYRHTTPLPNTSYPIVIFLHGNHGTCGRGANPRIDDSNEYTYTGVCSAPYQVVENHRGYDYIATELAERGYFVVSINANRGITQGDGPDNPDRPDPGLIRARGNLVLKHLQYLRSWSQSSGTTPLGAYKGKLDFHSIGLMGHSRGGEGVRAAVELYRRPGSAWPAKIGSVRFQSVFELAPTDGMFWEFATPDEPEHITYVNAQDTKWAVLLPMCDGDVKPLDGVKPFDRMLGIPEVNTPAMKASYTVWGANHNYFSTEWQQSDSAGCAGHRALFSTSPGVSGSAEQRQVAFLAMSRFFTATVGQQAQPGRANLFQPRGWAPPEPRVERGFIPSTNEWTQQPLEDFSGSAGVSRAGFPYQRGGGATISQVQIPEHDETHRGGLIRWSTGGSGTFVQIHWAPSGSGINLEGLQHLSLRVGRALDALNVDATTRFTVRLVGSSGALSSAQNIDTDLSLRGPVGSADLGANNQPELLYHSMLQTVELPLSGFTGVALSQVRGVRLVFNQTTSGAVYVADIAANAHLTADLWFGGGVGPAETQGATAAAPRTSAVAPRSAPAVSAPKPWPPTRAPTITAGNSVRQLLRKGTNGELVEVVLSTTTKIPFRDAALHLAVGDVVTALARFGSADRGSVRFTLRREDFDHVADGAPIRLYFGDGASGPIWGFGSLDKSTLR